jgi:hypothetical protein
MGYRARIVLADRADQGRAQAHRRPGAGVIGIGRRLQHPRGGGTALLEVLSQDPIPQQRPRQLGGGGGIGAARPVERHLEIG